MNEICTEKSEVNELGKILTDRPDLFEFLKFNIENSELIESATTLLMSAERRGLSMEKTVLEQGYNDFIYLRCEVALLENAEYMKKERSQETDPDELQADAEALCYKKGFNDAMKIRNNID